MLIEKGATKSLIKLKCQITKVEAEPLIEKDKCLQIIDSRIFSYEEK
jgi:hypothetical protein